MAAEVISARQAADLSVASYFPAKSGHRYHDAIRPTIDTEEFEPA